MLLQVHFCAVLPTLGHNIKLSYASILKRPQNLGILIHWPAHCNTRACCDEARASACTPELQCMPDNSCAFGNLNISGEAMRLEKPTVAVTIPCLISQVSARKLKWQASHMETDAVLST